MMRKDVKLGLAIGGVLLAVIVVYVLVGTGGDRSVAVNNSNNPAALVTEDHASAPAGGSSVGGSSVGGGLVAGAPAADSTKPSDAANAPANGASSALAGGAKPDSSTASPGKNDGHGGDHGGDMWGSVLNDGQLMMTQTPSAAGTDVPGGGTIEKHEPDNSAAANAPAKTIGDSLANAPATQPADALTPHVDSIANGPMTSTDTAGITHARTHVIQKGETLASIAQMAYGSANYFPAIKRANPKIDERKLKPGMTIVLPPVSDVKPDADKSSNTSGARRASAEIEPTRTEAAGNSSDTYRVVSGDTLERISIKLYGKRDMKDKIYELNKSTIGADPNRLKLNQVLKLPAPPTIGK